MPTTAAKGTVGLKTSDANLSDPKGILATVGGKLLVSADESHVVVELGQVTRLVAGTFGQKGFSGDGGPATLATFDLPGALAMDAQGNLFVADYLNHRIRRVDAHSGVVTTVAGNGSDIFLW
jgi:trimeric autotransporter adhesin